MTEPNRANIKIKTHVGWQAFNQVEKLNFSFIIVLSARHTRFNMIDNHFIWLLHRQTFKQDEFLFSNGDTLYQNPIGMQRI